MFTVSSIDRLLQAERRLLATAIRNRQPDILARTQKRIDNLTIKREQLIADLTRKVKA